MPDLLEPDYAPAFNAWKTTPSPVTSGALLSAVQPVLDAGIKSYGSGGDSPNLRSRARRIVLDALPTYDPARGPLRSHLDSQLRGLRRIGAEQDQIIHIPEQIRLDQHHVYQAENRLRDSLGRDPTDDELSDDVGLSQKRLAHIRRAIGGVPEGMMSRPMEDGDDAGAPVVVDSDDSAWNSFVYGSLPPIDQLVMEWSLGMNGKPRLSGQQIAKKLKVTSATVSQRRARIQSLLDQRRSLGVL